MNNSEGATSRHLIVRGGNAEWTMRCNLMVVLIRRAIWELGWWEGVVLVPSCTRVQKCCCRGATRPFKRRGTQHLLLVREHQYDVVLNYPNIGRISVQHKPRFCSWIDSIISVRNLVSRPILFPITSLESAPHSCNQKDPKCIQEWPHPYIFTLWLTPTTSCGHFHSVDRRKPQEKLDSSCYEGFDH